MPTKETGMATLIVRRLNEALVQRLKKRAAERGRSAEAEHRAILEQALRPRRSGRQLWSRLSRGEAMDIDFDRSPADQKPRPGEFD
jgi:plasmid stability protein